MGNDFTIKCIEMILRLKCIENYFYWKSALEMI